MIRHVPFGAGLALGLAAAALFPLVAGDYGIGVGLSLLSWIALAASWGVLSGMTGYISLGHAVFYGIGGYVMVLCWTELTPWLAVPLAGLAAAGLAAIQLGRYVQAAPLMETAASGARENHEAPLALAQVYLALHEPRKAMKAARQAVSVNPASPAAHEVLIAVLAQAGETDGLEQEQRRWRERQSK